MQITLYDHKATAIIDTKGAQLLSFKDFGKTEYLWQRAPLFWNKTSPLLFPIVGNCRNNRTFLEGREWEIPKHGFCRDMEFAITEQTTTTATLEIRHTEETKKMYPYSFRLSLTYTLQEGTLSMEYQVENTDDRIIHYCLGAHPGFNCPMEEDAVFEDYDLVFEKEETISSIIYDCKNLEFNPHNQIRQLDKSSFLPLSRNLFKEDAVYFDRLLSRKVSLINRKTGRGVQVSFPGFETVAFWSPYPANAPFVCIEPWNGSAVYSTEDDWFIHKNHIQTLNPMETKTYQLSIRILSA